MLKAIIENDGNTLVMGLAATELGVDSCIMGAPIAALASNNELLKLVGIPEGFNPVIGAVFGYATEDEPLKHHEITVNQVI